MDTQRLNATPENGESGSESKMCAKAKKIVGKTACFAGTAGLGVVGTMAVQAINITEDSDTAIGDVTSTSPTFPVETSGRWLRLLLLILTRMTS